MNCPDTGTLIGLDEASAAVQGHVEGCSSCARRVQALRRTASLLRRAPAAVAKSPCPPPERTRDVSDDHLADCDACQEALFALADAGEAAPDVSGDLWDRARELASATSRVTRIRRRATIARRRPQAPKYFVPLAIAAAAAVFLIILGLMSGSGGTTRNTVAQPPRPVPAPVPVPQPHAPQIPPAPEVAHQPQIPPAPQPETPEPEVAQQPDVAPAPQPETPEPEVAQQPTPQPETPAPQTPDNLGTETEPAAPALAARIGEIRGALRVERGEQTLEAQEGMEIASTDVLRSAPRDRASFSIDGTYGIMLREGSSARIEPAADETHLVLDSGEVFARVPPGSRTLRVTTGDADAIVHGTAFSVRRDASYTILTVAEGAVEFAGAHNSVMVGMNMRAVAVHGRVSRPEPVESGTALAWTVDPGLTGQPPAQPYLDVIPPDGATAYRGLVVSAPYADWETGACRIGRLAADRLGAGLVVGYRYRNQSDRRWMAIDRGTEAIYDADGNRGSYASTPAAEQVYAEWQGRMREAAAVPRGPVPMVVSFRNHSEDDANGEPLRVLEISANGLSATLERQMKELYDRLVAERAPAERFEVRFDQVDGTYDYRGQRRAFMFTESDAKQRGYMDAQQSRRSLCFFWPTSNLLNDEDARIYGEIAAQLIDLAWRSR